MRNERVDAEPRGVHQEERAGLGDDERADTLKVDVAAHGHAGDGFAAFRGGAVSPAPSCCESASSRKCCGARASAAGAEGPRFPAYAVGAAFVSSVQSREAPAHCRHSPSRGHRFILPRSASALPRPAAIEPSTFDREGGVTADHAGVVGIGTSRAHQAGVRLPPLGARQSASRSRSRDASPDPSGSELSFAPLPPYRRCP